MGSKRLRVTGLSVILVVIVGTQLHAQQRKLHYPHSADSIPGSVGRGQLTRGGPLRGYFQPVEVAGPEGSLVSIVVDGKFDRPKSESITVGMLIGEVYRLKVSNITDREGFEVFPTVEVVNRLYPPPGQKTRFPVPVRITKQELALALNGLFVTRVIYLENPDSALPQAEIPGFQRFFDVGSDQDPLRIADELGRPMAILRIGSRVPDEVASNSFIYGSPRVMKYKTPWRKAVPQELNSVRQPSEVFQDQPKNGDAVIRNRTAANPFETKTNPNFPKQYFRFSDFEPTDKP